LNNYHKIASDAARAIALCENLRSFTWKDHSPAGVKSSFLPKLLAVIHKFPLKEFAIHSCSDLGEETWGQINNFAGLRKVVIWCMEGPPRVLRGWADGLGETLTELVLGVNSLPYLVQIHILTSRYRSSDAPACPLRFCLRFS
jgi:hypothetical protein